MAVTIKQNKGCPTPLCLCTLLLTIFAWAPGVILACAFIHSPDELAQGVTAAAEGAVATASAAVRSVTPTGAAKEQMPGAASGAPTVLV